jgi:vacuolar-type H+-ATPase subunit C/Vma6
MKPELKTVSFNFYEYDDIIEMIREKFGTGEKLWDFDQHHRELNSYPRAGDFDELWLDLDLKGWKNEDNLLEVTKYLREVFELDDKNFTVMVKW